jgi:hypothetical protein
MKRLMFCFLILMVFALVMAEASFDRETGELIPQWVQNSLRYQMMNDNPGDGRRTAPGVAMYAL